MSEQRQQPPVWRVHWDVALMFRERGIIEMRAGRDLIGAELLWGAVARATKAVAEQRRWSHGSHGDLFRIARRLTGASGRSEVWEGMLAASKLHEHFYEGSLDIEAIIEKASRVSIYLKEAASQLGIDYDEEEWDLGHRD